MLNIPVLEEAPDYDGLKILKDQQHIGDEMMVCAFIF